MILDDSLDDDIIITIIKNEGRIDRNILSYDNNHHNPTIKVSVRQ